MSSSVAAPRRIVPETIQTSGMDCGPAALHSLLAGFGIPVSYGRLREACQTDVDGTSIDALEAAARALILDEPLGALDPHTARTILDVVRRRAKTLVVISQE